MKTIKPESIEMYLVSIRPKITYSIDNEEKTISAFVVSKSTYDKIGGSLQFDSVEERDDYLKQQHLKKIDDRRHGDERWFLYATHDELKAIQLKDEYQRIYSMYELGMVDEKDKDSFKRNYTSKIYFTLLKDKIVVMFPVINIFYFCDRKLLQDQFGVTKTIRLNSILILKLL